jgi:hypothetical protein
VCSTGTSAAVSHALGRAEKDSRFSDRKVLKQDILNYTGKLKKEIPEVAWKRMPRATSRAAPENVLLNPLV